MSLLRTQGHEVDFLTANNKDVNEDRPLRSALGAIWSTRGAEVMRERIERFRPDVIHVHNTFPLLSPSILHAAQGQRVPVVLTLHNFRLMCVQAMFLREGGVCEDCLGGIPWRGVVRRCYRGSRTQSAVLATNLLVHRMLGTYRSTVSRFVALNEFCKGKFIQGGLPEARIFIKPNFVDADPIQECERSGGLFVGRLSPEKGLSTLRDAVALLSGVSIDVLGEGPERMTAEGAAGLRMLGSAPPEQVRAHMLRAAFLVMPSIWYENFPRTLVEAFGAGLPVLASRIGALAEIVKDGRTGLLFEPGSAEDLAAKIQWARMNQDAMRTMGRNARQEYETKYTPEVNYRQLVGIYRSALNENRGR